jgi:hypothetical protein
MKIRNRRGRVAADLFTLRCAECDCVLVRTSADFMACPSGHGRLQLIDVEESDSAEPEPVDMFALSEGD